MSSFILRLALLVVALTSAVNVWAQSNPTDLKNEIEVRVHYAVPSGETSFSTTTNAGTTIDFGRDLDLKNSWGYDLRFTHRSENNKHKLLAEYSANKWDRTTLLTRTFTFLNQTYVANATIDSALQLRDFRAMYAYRWGDDKFRFGPMVDAGIINTSVQLTTATNQGTTTREGSITKLAATVGYDLEYTPDPRVNIFNNLGGIVFQGEHLFHTEGGVKVFFSRNVGVSGGYKFVRYKLEKDSNFITIREHGPFVGGVLRF